MFWNVKLWHNLNIQYFLKTSTLNTSFPLYDMKYAKCSNNFILHIYTHLHLCIQNIKTHTDNCSG